VKAPPLERIVEKRGKEKSTRDDLLVEIGVEELPHSFIAGAMAGFTSTFTNLLKESRVPYGEVRGFSTPRRLALLIRKVGRTQDDYAIEKRGPSLQKAYLPDGKPSPALQGFLRSNNSAAERTVVKDSGGGKYVFLELAMKGLATASLLPGVLEKTLLALAFPKVMKWEKTGFLFARPLRWVLFLLGEEVVPFAVAGVASSRATFGHRAYSKGAIELKTPLEYEKRLRGAGVEADRERRRESIRAQVDALTGPKGLQVPAAAQVLFERNTDLVENPHAVLCSFEEPFLELPPEVLMSEMMEHQHYFPLFAKSTGRLSNFFVAVSNISDNAETARGYQRVLRARLNDGKFFFNEDRKKNLMEHGARLASITFHEKLGTMDGKVSRIGAISARLAALLGLDEEKKERIRTVAALCKNDLVTLMVGEFPELQGIMGSYYALSSRYPEAVAAGIREHYLPRFAGDAMPEGIEGSVVGVADRLDTIVGIFSLGLKPSGSKDPFGLRRRVLGIIRIIIARRLNFSMHDLVVGAAGLFDGPGDRGAGNRGAGDLAISEVEAFFKNRIRSIFEEMEFAYDEIDASMANVLEDVYEAYRRVQALHEMRGNEDFERLLVSFTRMANIVEDGTAFAFSEDLLVEKEEKALHAHFKGVESRILSSIAKKDYRDVYAVLSGFKPSVDSFFDKVLVMEEDPALRGNRLGLLTRILSVFSGIIDFSKIVQAD
jgi:glycyl-tRNA synthetase beta chain